MKEQRDRPVDQVNRDDDEGADGDGASASEATPGEAFADLGRRFRELKEYFSYYLTAKRDAFFLSIRQAVLYAVLGVFALIAATAILATAGVLLVTSLGGAIGSAIGIPWLGNLIIALLVLLTVGIGVRAMISGVIARSHRQTVEKYEQRQRKQSARFGRNVHDSATAPRSEAASSRE